MSKLYNDLALEFLAYRIATRATIEVCDFHTPFKVFMTYNTSLIWNEARTDGVIDAFNNEVLPNFKRQLQLNKPQGAKFTKYINKHLPK